MSQTAQEDLRLGRPLPPGKLTYEEFLDWAPDGLHAEWVDGEVVFMTPVSTRHQRIAVFLTAAIEIFVQERKLGIVLTAPYQMKGPGGLPGREPDLIFLSNESMKRLKGNYLDGPADLAIEIISPESRKRDRVEKFREYEQAGVAEYWILDPTKKRTDFYRLGPDGKYLAVPLDEHGVFHSAVLPGLWIQPSWFWEDPMPSALDALKAWGIV